MKNLILAAMSAATLLSGCQSQSSNPLLSDFDTPFQTPPFDKIELEHYVPAFEAAIAEMKEEIEAIATHPEAPTFENTIVALERAGKRLGTVSGIFYNLNEAATSPEMDSIALVVQPMVTQAGNDVSLDERIFARVKAVYEAGLENPTPEEAMLLEDTYKGFTRSGAGLNDEDKATYRALTEELGNLTTLFGQNVLAATNAFEMTLTEEQVADLPDFVKEGMAADAASRGREGWLLTLQAPSYVPFMTYSTDRALKEQLWRAYGSRAFNGEFDNSKNVQRIAELRIRLANLLGYPTYAEYALENRMAGNQATVTSFLQELLDASKSYAQKDFDMIRAYAAANGQSEFKPWDFGYWDEKYKNATYSLSDEETKPYFELGKVQEGIFLLANKLFGLTFVENREIPLYHPDVQAFEVHDGERLMAILYLDFFPRESKRPGAWMTEFRGMYRTADGTEVRPLISLNGNFTKPTETTPSLLTFDEVVTFLHEFGHGLHGILAEGTYASLTGTNVYRDFVELPSQIMENWATEKDFLDLWAVHYQTGEKMPAELIRKIVDARQYLAPYLNVRQLSYGMNDMAWHTLTAPETQTVDAFERGAIAPTQFFPFETGTCVSTSFSHIFSGGYAAGYYSYKWAEVLEADAFDLFRQNGIFDRATAQSFRDNILSKGGSENPMSLYVRFRGRQPDNKALLRKMGVE